MRSNSISKKRHNNIIQHLQEKGKVNVNDLSQEFEVSPITIRRDLDHLSDKGLLDRTHGGAMVKKRVHNEALFIEKDSENTREKDDIGRIAASMINDGDTVLLNSGSTTLQVIRHLHGKKVRIITNNAAAMNIVRDPKIELIIIGGEYREASHSLVGDMALLSLSQIYSSCTILGTNGINTEFGLTSSVYQETGVNRVMIEKSQGSVIVLADHTKLGEVSNFLTAPITQIDILVTDSGVDKNVIDQFEKIGIKVVVAQQEHENNQ